MGKARKAAAPEQNDDLVDAVRDLTAEVRVLRDAIDELREEVQYAANNLFDPREPPLPHRRITSMPKDPLADDFGERINAYTPEDLPTDAPDEPAESDRPPNRPPGQLF